MAQFAECASGGVEEFGGEGASPDAGAVGLGDAHDAANGGGGDAEARADTCRDGR